MKEKMWAFIQTKEKKEFLHKLVVNNNVLEVSRLGKVLFSFFEKNREYMEHSKFLICISKYFLNSVITNGILTKVVFI